ncbi:hypothetical protein KA005_62660, partial [bacterium]|nr:hypothetical protein [bacterium]
IVTISESLIIPGLIWVGTDDGNVQITQDSGNNWENVRSNVPGVPEDLWVSRVEASHFKTGTAYLTFDGHRSDNFKPWVFKTTDYGKTWTNISNNIPDGQPVYVIKEDLKNRNLLFVGTEFAVFYSINGGESWTKLNNNMPTVAVHDLLIHPRDNDLIAGTHGRGIWILDDITPLQQATKTVLEANAFLFKSRVTTQWLNIRRGGNRGHLYFEAPNPPKDAVISYYLKTAPPNPVKIKISNITNTLARTYSIKGEPGIHKLEWNMRFDPTVKQRKAFITQMKKRIEQELKKAASERRKELKKLQKELEQAGIDVKRLSDFQSKMIEFFYGGVQR